MSDTGNEGFNFGRGYDIDVPHDTEMKPNEVFHGFSQSPQVNARIVP
jgi:hypothetical protein